MGKDTGNRIRLGVFVTVGLLFFTAAVYYVGNKQNLFGQTFTINAVFRNVGGLQPGNNVRYAGINVGTVERLHIVSDSTVKVDMVLVEEVRKFIKKDAIASIGSDGLVGNMLVNISPGNGALPSVDDNDEITSYSRVKTDDIFNALSSTNENLGLLTVDLLRITESINRGQGTVATLLNDTTLAINLRTSVKNLNTATYQINYLTRDLRDMMSQVNQGQGLAGTLLKDTVFAQSLHAIMGNLEITGKELNELSTNLRTSLEGIDQGDGLINTLVHDSSASNDLKHTLENLNKGTAKFNENMEAMKHNFLFRKYFKKQEKQKKSVDAAARNEANRY
ncbi:MAG: MlaD family protein [Cyclobacteriaceae bacterium]